MNWSMVFLVTSGMLSIWAVIFSVKTLLRIFATKLFEAGMALEREQCASLAEHCTHSCMTKAHCDALHAAHRELAAQIRGRGGTSPATTSEDS